jgi:TonB family protein
LAFFAGLGPQHQQPTCDHAAPPEGMHYVCANQDSCDCRIVADAPSSGDESEKGSRIPVPDLSPCNSGDVKYFVAPDYPLPARQAAKQGTVIARLGINSAGDVNEVIIQSGDPLLTGPVIQTLKNWKFAPTGATQTASVSVTFALAGNSVTKPAATTVSGSSPLNLVITANPVMPRRAHNHERTGSAR